MVCTHISELGTEPMLIKSALKRDIRLCILLFDLSDFWVSSYDLKFLCLKDRWRHTGYHAFYTDRSGLILFTSLLTDERGWGRGWRSFIRASLSRGLQGREETGATVAATEKRWSQRGAGNAWRTLEVNIIRDAARPVVMSDSTC